MELYKKVRLACAEGMSKRAAAKNFNISRGTVEKMLALSIPPGYRRDKPIRRPKLDGFRATLFSGLQSHYLFRDRYGRPRKGNDKGAVEGIHGYARRNHMVPIPHFANWDAFNADLEGQCVDFRPEVTRVFHRELTRL